VRRRLLAPFLIAAWPPSLAAQEPAPPTATVVAADPRLAAVRRTLLERVGGGRMPSIVVAVAENGRTIWEEAIGWADRERRIPATPQTPYALGSLSKSLTGVTLLALVERGALALDDPIDRWFRLRAPTGVQTQPTLRELLDASGGIPHGWRSAPPADAPAADAAWDAWMEGNALLAFAAGTVFEYSNLSFGVAARVAERATGMTFEQVARRYLFAPLGMEASHTVLAPALVGTAAALYHGGTAITPVASIPDGGLGMVSSAADLLRFGLFVRGHTPGDTAPLSPARRAMLWQPAAGPAQGFFHFGFWNGGRVLVTNGNIRGANAHLAIARDADIVVAVVVNQTGGEADRGAGAVLDALLPPGSTGDTRTAYEAAHRQPWRAHPEWDGSWEGQILAAGGAIAVRLDVAGDSLQLRVAEQTIALGGATTSAFGDLRAGMNVTIPGLTPAGGGATAVRLALHVEGDDMIGYLLPQTGAATPVPIRLRRAGPERSR